MKNLTLTASAYLAVFTGMPAAQWQSFGAACWLPVSTLRLAGHDVVLGEKSAPKQEQILRGAAMSFSGFGNPVDVNASRVRVTTGTPPRSRPV